MLLTRKLAFGGIAAAMILIAVSVSYVSPTADLALFTLSSFFIAMVVIETDFMTGFAAYLASSILITVFFGIYYAIPFLVLFGLFPLLKGIIEKKHMKRVFAYLIEAVYFCSLLAIALFAFNKEAVLALTKWNQILPEGILSTIQSVWIMIFITIIVLFLYDYALTLLIGFYQKRIQKWIRRK